MSPCSLFVRGRTDCKLVRGPDGAGAAVEGVRCAPLDTVGRDSSNHAAQPRAACVVVVVVVVVVAVW